MLVAGCLIGHFDRVAFGVHQKTFFTRQSALHRFVEQPCSQRCMRLIAHVFFAAECTTISHERDGHLLIWDCK